MTDQELHKLGEVLRTAREAKGVDLARVERDTKIRARYVTALETGDYGELPGAVYTDTVNTGTDGAVSTVTLNRATLAQPDTAIVEVRAFRTRGAPVAGSGQRFTVIFQ